MLGGVLYGWVLLKYHTKKKLVSVMPKPKRE